ncbi:MAG TPA: N,N-dimethylformamidase beta subunit family domain-containing protein [Verrucomicrobiae bacterium]
MKTGEKVGACCVALFVMVALHSSEGAERSKVITVENAKVGTTDWVITKIKKGTRPPKFEPDNEPYEKGWRHRKELEGYVSHTSIRAGETLKVYVSTDPAIEFKFDLYRLGYYGGKGARLVKSFGNFQGVAQPIPRDGERNVRECKWTETTSFEIPKDWVSGVYLGKLAGVDSDAESYVIFIVKDDRPADLIFQCSDMTWLSYNRWPQWRSLYDNDGEPWGASNGRLGYDVSFDRPYAMYWNGFPLGFEPLTLGSGEFLMIEFPLAFWLEKEGYDVTYISNVDTHAEGKGLLRAKGWVSVGHDEYWTQEMFDNVMAARDGGVSLAFLSGNSVSGRVTLSASSDGVPNRIMRRAGGFRDEAKLMGSTSYGVGFADWTCDKPDHWIFQGTGMKKGDRIKDLVGWEYHGAPLADYESMEVLSSGKVYGWNGDARDRTYATTLYTAEKGNFVFNAGTCWWNMVLSRPPGFMNPPRRYFSEPDARVQQITRNVLNRMIELKTRSNNTTAAKSREQEL